MLDLRYANNLEIIKYEGYLKGLGEAATDKQIKKLAMLKKQNEEILTRLESASIDILGVLDFLKRIHNEIEFNHRVEIKCLPIKEDDKVISIALYGFGIENQLMLLKKLDKLNLKEYNIYYSLYRYELTDIKRRMINSANSRCTSVLALDFDKIDSVKKDELYKFFTAKDIRPMIVSSGYGYHFLFRLNKTYYDIKLLAIFNRLVIEELGLPADSSVKDCARVLRLPFTFNCKKVLNEDGTTDYSKALACTVVQYSGNTYSAEELFKKLGGSYTYVESSHGLAVKEDTLAEGADINYFKTLQEVVKTHYSGCLKHLDLPLNILQMLCIGGREGARNECIMYLIYFFKNYLNYNKLELKRLIVQWNNLTTQSLDSKELESTFERLFKRNYGCEYSKKLQEIYGAKDTKSYTKIKKLVLDNKVQNVVIPNKLFMYIDKLNITGVRIFLYYLLITNRVKLDDRYFTYVLKEDLASAAGVSGRTLDRYLNILVKCQLLMYTKLPTTLITNLKVEGKKVNGNTKAITLHTSIQLNTNYTKITKDILQYLLVDLSDIGGVLYVYTYSQLNRLGSDFNLSQVTIGNKLNISQGAVSTGYKELLTKGYLKKASYGKGANTVTYWVDNSDKILKNIKTDMKNVQNTEVEKSSIDTLVLNL